VGSGPNPGAIYPGHWGFVGSPLTIYENQQTDSHDDDYGSRHNSGRRVDKTRVGGGAADVQRASGRHAGSGRQTPLEDQIIGRGEPP
jgi:hypothetical protein